MSDWGAEFLKLAEMLPQWAAAALSYDKRRKLSSIAKLFAELSFWNEGFRAPLTRIAEGRATESDFEEMRRIGAETSSRVSSALSRLRDSRAFLGEICSGELAHQLDEVVWEKVGPGRIRTRLEQIAQEGECSRSEAKELLSEIAKFNRRLGDTLEAIRAAANGSK